MEWDTKQDGGQLVLVDISRSLYQNRAWLSPCLQGWRIELWSDERIDWEFHSTCPTLEEAKAVAVALVALEAV